MPEESNVRTDPGLTKDLREDLVGHEYPQERPLRTSGPRDGLQGSDIGHAPYCASKSGVIGLTRTAAIGYARQGIRVNAVCPGFTLSEMVDPSVEVNRNFLATVVGRHSATQRFGEAEEVGALIAWPCSDAARFVNGASLPIDGGESSRLY